MLPLQRVTVLLTLVAGLSAGLAHADALVQFDGFTTGAFSSGTDDGFSIAAVNGNIWSGGFPGNSAGSSVSSTWICAMLYSRDCASCDDGSSPGGGLRIIW